MRFPRRTLAAATLSFEALVVFFAGLVAKDLSSLSPGGAVGLFSALALACLVSVGLLGSRIGYVIGWLMQAAAIATGFWVPVMFFLGGVFAVLWWVALTLGARMERQRAASGADR